MKQEIIIFSSLYPVVNVFDFAKLGGEGKIEEDRVVKRLIWFEISFNRDCTLTTSHKKY